jgi:hypothetical protein
MGTHPPESVEAALEQLVAEGLIERDESGRSRLPA